MKWTAGIVLMSAVLTGVGIGYILHGMAKVIRDKRRKARLKKIEKAQEVLREIMIKRAES